MHVAIRSVHACGRAGVRVRVYNCQAGRHACGRAGVRVRVYNCHAGRHVCNFIKSNI